MMEGDKHGDEAIDRNPSRRLDNDMVQVIATRAKLAWLQLASNHRTVPLRTLGPVIISFDMTTLFLIPRLQKRIDFAVSALNV